MYVCWFVWASGAKQRERVRSKSTFEGPNHHACGAAAMVLEPFSARQMGPSYADERNAPYADIGKLFASSAVKLGLIK